MRGELHRLRLRQAHTQLLRQARKKLARRRKTQPADAAKPVLLETELVGQPSSRQIPAVAGGLEPLYRLCRNLTHANLHARINRTKSPAS